MKELTAEEMFEILYPFIAEAYQQGYVCAWKDEGLRTMAKEAVEAVLKAQREVSDDSAR